MTFLHLGLLIAFVPVVAAPIILHLLTLHKLRTIELSTYRFLFDGEVRSRRRFQFEDMLLAILRTLFLLFIVMALARPTVSRWGALFGGMASGRDVVLLIDASASMGVTTDGRSAMQQAKQAANSVVENLAKQDRVTVIRVASRAEEICSRFASNPDSIRESIDQLEAGPARANWFAALMQTFQSGRLANPRVYVVSDMQASGWRELKTGETAGLLPDDTEMFLINVGSQRPIENQGIVAGLPDDRNVLVGLPVTLRPRVVNFSANEAAEVPISVFANDEEVARKTVSVEPGQAAEAELIYTPEQPGIQRLRYEIPDDRFAADNSYRFTLSASSTVNVVLVNGHPSSDPLEDRGLFLRSALTVEADQVQSLRVTEVRQSRLNAGHLRDADVLILADCGELAAAAHLQLRRFVAEGGGLLVLPGEQVEPGDYNRHLFAGSSPQEGDLLAVRLRATIGTTGQTAAFDPVGGVDFAHPVFSVFRDPDEHYLSETRAYRRFELVVSESAKKTWTLARFADGSPLIVAGRFGKGRVLQSAIPFDATWSNLPLQPEFVPLVLRMVAHLQRRSEASVAAVIPAEGVAEITVDESWEAVNGSVLSNSRVAAPLEFEQDRGRFVSVFDKTTEAAFYEVSLAGGSAGDRKEATLAFAVNTAADESRFDSVTHRQLSDWLPTAKLTMIDASPETQQRHGQVGSKRELWRTLICLALVAVAVELTIATAGGNTMRSAAAPRSIIARLFNDQPRATGLARQRNATALGSLSTTKTNSQPFSSVNRP